MKKILLYVHELTYSGSPNSTLRLAKALRVLGHDVTVWSYKDGLFRNEYVQNNIKIEIVLPEELRDRKTIRKYKHFDLLIANSILTREALEAISNFIPSIWYIREAHNIPSFFTNDYKRGYMLKYSKSNIWAVSEYAKSFIDTFFNKKTYVVHNCVDDVYEKYNDSSEDNQRIKIIMIGTIESRKNFLLYLNAYNQLGQEEQQKLEIHIVGRQLESEKTYFNKVMKEVQKSENILYHGEIRNRDELMNLLANMNIVAVVSKDESCSLTALEGAMMGKALILSENVGAKYLLSNNNGWIVKTNNKFALTKIFSEITQYKNEELLEMGERSREVYLTTSTFDIYISNVKEAIEKHGFQNKLIYYIKNSVQRIKWYIDETESYYEYPNWGYEDEKHHIYSFDIFDTIITRDVARPDGIFLLMQEELYKNPKYNHISPYIKDNFVQLRIGAEGLARQHFCINGVEDKTLEEIYQALCMTGKINEDIAKELMILEIETEYEHSVKIPYMINQIKELVADNKKVILISDMYLDVQSIRRLLIKHDNIFTEIPIYVSSECKKMKGSTHLFKYIQNIEGVNFKNWSHVGDNENADIKAPSSLGIQVKKFSKANLTEYEKNAITEMPLNLNVQLQIGLSRKLRVSAVHPLSEYEMTGAGIGGCIVLPYVYWVVKNAFQLNCKKILFFKENFLVKKIADIIISASGYNLKTEILELDGFEKLWNYLFTHKMSSPQQLALQLENLIDNETITVEELMRMLMISEKEIMDLMPQSIYEHFNQFPQYDKSIFKWLLISDENQQFIFDKWKHQKQILANKEKENAAIVCINTTFIHNSELYGIIKNSKYNLLVFSNEFMHQVNEKNIKYFIPVNKNHKYNIYPFYLSNLIFDKLSEEEKNLFKEYEEGLINFAEEFVQNVYLCKHATDFRLLKKYCNHIAYNCSENIAQFINHYSSLICNSSDKTTDNMSIITYNLNNTLMTGDFASKEGIFLLMKKKVLDEKIFNHEDAEEVIAIRKEMENYSGYIRKTSLDKIYNNILGTGRFQTNAVKKLQEIELQIEEEHSKGITTYISDIVMNYINGKKIIIICNSYFPTDFIRNLLLKEDEVFENIPIYTTCECPNIENSEDIFKYVHDLENLSYKKWKHIGSDLAFDVNGPKKLGIHVERTELTKLMPYENAALKEFGNNIVVQHVVGLSKILRINKNLTKHEILGCFGGAMLYGYVQWLIDDAIDRGFEKLLFIARDGYVLKLIADTIIYNQNITMETEYVYGSRKAWRMPSYTSNDDLTIFFKMAHISQLRTMDEFSKIFGITYNDLKQFIPDKYQDNNYILKKEDYKFLKEYLENQPAFKKYLENQAYKSRKLVSGYIKQVMKNRKCAFVELSGTGMTQNCISKIISTFTAEPVYTYFLNLDSLEASEKIKFINYIPNNTSKIYIIENLCRAIHGQTVSYEIVNNEYHPILEASQEEEALIRHGYLPYLGGLLYYAEAFSLQKNLTVQDKECPIIFQKYLRHLVYNPCHDLLDFIGDMPFETTGNKNDLHYFAPVLTEDQIKQIFFDRVNESIDEYYFGACLDFSIKRMSLEDRNKIGYYQNLISSKEGQKIRMKKRLKERGYLYTTKFICRRLVRGIFLRMGIIRYKN